LFPLFEEWGIAGVKFGFVQVGPKEWSDWLHDAVRKAAKHRLLVDIHDAYRPSGFSRLYPNLLTQEGVRGNEHMPTARHNATLPFTRCVAGAADYTICYYSNRIQTTHAHQLALAVVIYSPLQFVFWYDRPSAYQGEPEVEFFAHVPTAWDDTRVLQGAIGEYAVIARRKDDIWFVGSITNEEARTLQIPLSFLDATKRYVAYVYSDTPVAPDNRTGVKVESHEVDASGGISAVLAPGGGQAMRLVPIDGE
jgi:alpha-glucosidase